MIKIKRGLDIPIQGAPRQAIEEAPAARAVALVGFDYVGMKPTMAVAEGDRVKLGQLLFTDKKTEGVRYTAPAAGTVSAINRGAKRVLQSVVIEVDGDEAETFPTCTPGSLPDASSIRSTLVQSGQWTALRTRPYSKVPAPDSDAAAIFVNAMDTQPLAGDPAAVIAQQGEAFALGLDLLAQLTPGKVYVCAAPGAELPGGSATNIAREEFAGPHPAGLAGTHIHFLEGVGTHKTVWTIGYQDVIAVGRLFLDGRIYTAPRSRIRDCCARAWASTCRRCAPDR
jgi:Na+-transporting NADH:ubiquinone oxidoreductase subunit A